MPKKLTHDKASAVMRENGAEPLEEYPGSAQKWHCKCLKCGADIWPRFGPVSSKGAGPCKFCAVRKQTQKVRTPSDEAVAIMLERDFQPSVPYQRIDKPWPGVCLRCGRHGSPSLGAVNHSKQNACAYCAGKKVDSSIAVGKMLAVDFQPSVPFQTSDKPWPGVCLKCNMPGAPRYNAIHQGQGACNNCNKRGYKRNKPGFFYVVANDSLLKGGIANAVTKRLSVHKRQGLTEVLHLWKFSDGSVPEYLERLWKEYLDMLPDDDRPAKSALQDGYTEAACRTTAIEEWVEQVLKPLADECVDSRLGSCALVGAQ